MEPASRSTLLVHLPRLDGWGQTPPVKNGPALGGYGAIAMNAALTASMTQLPEQLRKTLTWDRGKELSAHAQFALETGTKVFFADPHSPWQRPTNENTNGLLRQYFPKGTDLSRWTADGLAAVALALNNRPRKILGWRTPAEVFEEQLRSIQQAGVATTGLNSPNMSAPNTPASPPRTVFACQSAGAGNAGTTRSPSRSSPLSKPNSFTGRSGPLTPPPARPYSSTSKAGITPDAGTPPSATSAPPRSKPPIPTGNRRPERPN